MQHVTYSYQEWCEIINSQQIDTLKSVNNSNHNDHNAVVEI